METALKGDIYEVGAPANHIGVHKYFANRQRKSSAPPPPIYETLRPT